MALSCLVQCSENIVSNYDSPTNLADHETHALVELLSHSLHGRGKEGGYSAATFTLKSVLYAIRCMLSEPKNRHMFSTSTGNNGRRLNTLLLKAVARYSTLDGTVLEVIDAEAVEHALVSISDMSLYGLDDATIGFACPLGRGTFLPAAFGKDGRWETKKIITKVLISYLEKDGMTARSRYAANQILLRLDYLRFAGSVADLVSSTKDDYVVKSKMSETYTTILRVDICREKVSLQVRLRV